MAVMHSMKASTSGQTETAVLQTGTTPSTEVARLQGGLRVERDHRGERPSEETATLILEDEEGNEEESNRSLASELLPSPSIAHGLPARKELAQSLTASIQRILQHHGKLRMAADVQVLKHALSKAHNVLGPLPSESNYLSVITLLESNLSNMDWKHTTKEQLRVVKRALELGLKQSPVTFSDYTKAARQFRGSSLPTLPQFEFGEEDLNLDEEEGGNEE